MAKKIVIKYCLHCKYCGHTGAFDPNRKYVCRHSDAYNETVGGRKKSKVDGVNYWYGQPVIGATENVDENTAIPSFCPLEDNIEFKKVSYRDIFTDEDLEVLKNKGIEFPEASLKQIMPKIWLASGSNKPE